MSKDPAFLLYSQDFLVGTHFFTHEQVGRYIRMLCLLHQHGGSICQKKAEKILEKDPEILVKFELNNGQLTHRRLKKEMARRRQLAGKQRDNANKRWHRNGNATALPPHMDRDCLSVSVPVSVSASVPVAVSASVSAAKKTIPCAATAPRAQNGVGHAEIIRHYKAAYERHVGAAWHVHGGKVGAQIKRLLATYDAAQVCAMIDLFFASTDEFIVRAGRDFGVFYSQINKLAAGPVRPAWEARFRRNFIANDPSVPDFGAPHPEGENDKI